MKLFFSLYFLVAIASAQQPGTVPAEPNQSSPTTASEPKSASKNGNSAQQILQSPEFTQQVAEALLERLAEGLRGHKLEQTRSVFAAGRFDPAFFDRMRAAFDNFESFHLYYHIEDVSEQEGRAAVVADFDLESVPAQSDSPSQRRHAKLRMQLERVAGKGAKAWRIVSLTPERFFFDF